MKKKQTAAVIVGTRPEAIKMAPIINILKEKQNEWNCYVISTAQHRDLLDQAFRTFSIQSDYDLNIMTQGQSIAQVTERAINGLDNILSNIIPDIVLVQGDTTTTFTGALAAFYNKIKVAHIEAGLRTRNKYSPFPEEINRRLTTQLSDLHFTPTNTSKINLLKEGIDEKNIYISGNTVIDAMLTISNRPDHDHDDDLLRLNIRNNKRLILVTLHRRESFGRPLENILKAISKLASKYSNARIVYPVHPNPNVKTKAEQYLGNLHNVDLIPPLDYEPFIKILKKAYFVITDSGGVQEEAPSLGIPILVTREETERPEAIEAGAALIVGSNEQQIIYEATKLMEDQKHYECMKKAVNPYGDGKAAERIESRLRAFLLPELATEVLEPFSWSNISHNSSL